MKNHQFNLGQEVFVFFDTHPMRFVKGKITGIDVSSHLTEPMYKVETPYYLDKDYMDNYSSFEKERSVGFVTESFNVITTYESFVFSSKEELQEYVLDTLVELEELID